MEKGIATIPFRWVILIILVGIAVYLTSLAGEFIWDDVHFIIGNTYLRTIRSLPRILTEDVAAGSGQTYNYYRPLTVISYFFDYSFWNLNPVGYHISSIFAHLLVAVSVSLLTALLFRDPPLALLVGLLYAVHPIHTETVAYISGRPDSLAALFSLLAMVVYLRRLRGAGVWSLAVLYFCYLLALLSRENSIVFPGLIIAFHLVFRKKISWAGFLPVSVLALAYCIIRMVRLGASPAPTTFFQRIPGFFAAQAYYFRLLLVPIDLHQEYGFRLFSFSSPPVIAGIIITAILLTGLITALVRLYSAPDGNCRAVCRPAAFGILWYFIALLPVSGIYPIRAFLAEHWLYLPWIGLIWAGVGLYRLIVPLRGRRLPTTAAVFAVIVIFGVLTALQNGYFRDPLSFYERTVRYNPTSARLYNNLGNIYYSHGLTRRAAESYEKAIELEPAYPNPYNNLGNLYFRFNNHEKAARLFQKALELYPGYAAAYNNLALIAFEKGETERGIELLKNALRLQPQDADTLYNLGVASGRLGRRSEQIRYYQRALRLRPDSVRVRHALERAQAEKGSNQ